MNDIQHRRFVTAETMGKRGQTSINNYSYFWPLSALLNLFAYRPPEPVPGSRGFQGPQLNRAGSAWYVAEHECLPIKNQSPSLADDDNTVNLDR